MITPGEVFAIAAMFAGAAALITFMDWLYRKLPDTIGQDTPWGDVVRLPDEIRPARKGMGERSAEGGRAGNETTHSTSPQSHCGREG